MIDEHKERQRVIGAAAACELIKEAREAGRQIIPLFGSGMSVDAGFPPAAHLSDYLIRFNWWLRETGQQSVVSYLRSHAWPSRHDLNAFLWAKGDLTHGSRSFGECLENQEHELNKLAMVDELKDTSPTAALAVSRMLSSDDLDPHIRKQLNVAAGRTEMSIGYRSLLNYLCDRDGNLIDAFFDHFARNRKPSTTHQFIVFVTQLLGCRLILTTNVDTFIETALRDEGLDPTVYEILRDASIPNARLLRNQKLSVVKLHGGAYSLRAGFDLDERLSPGALAEYREYFSSAGSNGLPPLIVAVGYSGSDRRVMDILATHLVDWKSDERNRAKTLGPTMDGAQRERPAANTRLLWISRNGEMPPRLEQITLQFARQHSETDDSSIACPYQLCRCWDGRLFLQELYQIMTRQHPTARAHYRVFPTILPGASTIATSKSTRSNLDDVARFRKTLETERGYIVFSGGSGAGTSTLLARACRAMDGTHTTIWVDASEFRCRATLFAAIEEALHRYDRHLTRVSHPLMFNDVNYLVRKCGPTRFAKDIEVEEEKVAIRWLRDALRRGRYVLAIDSLGEFGSGHPAMRDDAQDQIEKMLSFFRKLIDERLPDYGEAGLGESKVFIAMTGKKIKLKGVLHDHRSGGKPPGSIGRETEGRFAAMVASDSVDEKQLALLLMLASFWRRPRDRAGLFTVMVRTIRKLRERKRTAVLSSLAGALLRAFDDGKKEGFDEEEDLTQVEKILANLDRAAASPPLLARREGGFYWMHVAVRNGIFELVSRRTKNSNTLAAAEVALIFDVLADFYHDDVYERSQDSMAFMEYFFHRLMSIEWEDHHQGMPDILFRRAKWLICTIELEKERLLARGRLTGLLNLMRVLLNLLLDRSRESHTERHDYGELVLKLLGIYADVFIACGHPHEAMQYRLLQAQLLVKRLKSLGDGRLLWPPCPATAMRSEQVASLTGIKERKHQKTVEKLAQKLIVEATNRKAHIETLGDAGIKGISEMRDTVRGLRAAVDLMIDLGAAIADPVLFGYDGIPKNRWRWESERARKCRFTLPQTLFEESETIAKFLRERAASDQDTERWTRARIRRVEHLLRDVANYRFKAILPKDVDLRDTLQAAKRHAEVTRLVDEALEEIRFGPSSSRRRRHKCYLYIAKARVQGAREHWESGGVSFQRAQAALSRAAGTADRAALGMAQMFQAESCLLNAEVEGIDDKARLKLYRECELRLQQAGPALEQEGRTENRWRVFYNYLSAKLHYQRAMLAPTLDQRQDELFVAMRCVVAALINTGKRSDRQTILQWMRDLIEDAVQKISPALLEDMRRRIGLLPAELTKKPSTGSPGRPKMGPGGVVGLRKKLSATTSSFPHMPQKLKTRRSAHIERQNGGAIFAPPRAR